MINNNRKSINLKKGAHTIKVKIGLSKEKGYGFAYTLKEKRVYKCNTTPKLVKTLSKLEKKGFVVEEEK